MKKLIYILLVSVITIFSVSSCTEEQVEPSISPSSVGGGGASEDSKK
jgi:hypothetical protein